MMRLGSSGSSSSTDSFYSCSSTDPTLLPLPTGEYEVFLSFRGSDVRRTFADCLYTCLVRSKIHTFRDDEELRKGETIGPALIQAIAESKICIPILTQNYASSKWCLQELAKMVECWKNGGKGQPIFLPVFYFIDPRDVRDQDFGPYREAFEQHSMKHDQETILKWKHALQQVGKMKGWHVTESDGHGAVIDQIFSEVELHLRANYTFMTNELVGIGYHVAEVVKLLNLDSASEKIVGIHGMGGLGKTALAKAVYDKISSQFERCCFLENVRDTLLKHDGAVALQNKIISDILMNDSNVVKDANDGIRVIRKRVCRHKLLIVLDDVDGNFVFDDILGDLDDFSMDSRFLITTRDARVLEILQDFKSFELEEMSHEHSLRLFSKHAFGADCPSKDFASLSEEFVQVAAGLPLAIKVIGSLLFHTDKTFWEAKLVELKEIPPVKVQERLKISYNELTHYEKQIFLDVACFFVGEKKKVPMYMWSDCDFYPASTIRTLVQRSLLKVKKNKVFWMHDHIRDLGRAIVRGENTQNPYKRSRIWSNRDAVEMLKNREGSDCVEALVVDMHGEYQLLTNKDFEKLSRLRYLEVRNGGLVGNFKGLLPNIRWLRLYRCYSYPTGLNLRKLVILGLENCPVRDSWKGWNKIKVAHKLKVVNLSWCFYLKKVPGLSSCRNLELLDLSQCWEMRGELDIGNFKNMRLLGVKRTQITSLKGEIGMLQNLRKIDVSHTRLSRVPRGISKLTSLEVLDLTFYDSNQLYLTEMLPGSLKSLAISTSSLPALPSSLNYLDISYSERLLRLPDLGNLTNLMELSLKDVGIDKIPGLGELKLLEILNIVQAPNLDNMDGLEKLVLLRALTIHHCKVLGKLPSLANLTKLLKLDICGCWVLSEPCEMGELQDSLSYLSLSHCHSFAGVEALQSMVKLETLVLHGLGLTKALPPSLSTFSKLRRLTIGESYDYGEDHGALKQFPDLSNLKILIELRIKCCSKLIEVTGLDKLELLELLVVWYCWSISKLPDLSGLKKLKELQVTECIMLRFPSLFSLLHVIYWLSFILLLFTLVSREAEGLSALV